MFIFLITLFSTIALRVMLPFFIGQFFEQVIYNQKYSQFIFYLLLIGLIGVSITALQYINTITNEYLAWTVETSVREEFFDEIQNKSMYFHNKVETGDIMALATNDARMINVMISPGFRMVVETILMFTSIIISLVLLSPILTLFILLLAPAYVYRAYRYQKSLSKASMEVQQNFGKLSAVLNDTLSGIRVVKAFNGEAQEKKKFFAQNLKLQQASSYRSKIIAYFFPLPILYLMISFAFIGGSWLALQGEMSLGVLVTYIGLLSSLQRPTNFVSFAFTIYSLGWAGSQRIIEMIEREYIEEEEGKLECENLKVPITFKNVSFRYDKDTPWILKNITFTVHPGELVAIVGPTGSGKTTLMKLLYRFYDPVEGEILAGNINIKNYTLASYRHRIGVVEQDVFLFSSTIKENIAFGKQDASMEEIIEAAKLAQAHDFIMQLDKTYETEVGERGVRLSGGQKQRIAIARAFLTNPDILIMDDSMSAVDSETEEKIGKAIETLLKGRTTFIITHRLNMLRKASKILVIKKGELVAEGTHEKLLYTSPEYRQIFAPMAEDLPPLMSEDDFNSKILPLLTAETSSHLT